jgi:hypothetical protein
MSHVSISRSYAILVGLESYTAARRKIKDAEAKVVHKKDKLIDPEKVQAEEEAKQDKSESAAKERLFLEEQRKAQAEDRHAIKIDRSLSGMLPQPLREKFKPHKHSHASTSKTTDQTEPQPKREPGTGPEDGVPAPEGQR